MEKKLFYLSVQGRSILEDHGATSFEWTVEATPEEADNLRGMLERIAEKEESSFLAFTYPWPDTPEEEVNAGYQSHLNELYREIYRLGTKETRDGIGRYLAFL
ncbi:hypothetical protein J2T12_004245 [Paenibacillus anaericanus]|uniref:hypothetical protein n=1 Tax=Paenibacillus anaericanus TaxID=170367 RepID=UPI0027873B28|nr:hypothetical protein [Paenibacillus anaericanus]MDQ0090822.1 hypothetical protein [Paenibacillus anaericanus]